MINHLGMLLIPSDQLLYVKGEGENIEGISEQYADDSLNAGNESFEASTERTLNLFESKPCVYGNFDFFGTKISTTKMGEFFIGQKYNVYNLTNFPDTPSFEDFHRYRALVTWIGHTRPDLMCHAKRASQVSEKTFAKEKTLELNCAIKRAKTTADFGLLFPNMNKDCLYMRVYADASFV